jgi:uncharacterized protein YjbI with pentapeptide repeats
MHIRDYRQNEMTNYVCDSAGARTRLAGKSLIPTLSFLVLSFCLHTKVLDATTRDALHQQILAGDEIYLNPSSPEADRTIDANWVKDAATRHVRIHIRNAVIQGRLDLQDSSFEQEFDLAGCIVKDYADFSHTTFRRDFFASDAVFISGVSFQSATFEHKAIFQRTHFKGDPIIFADAHFLAEFNAEAAEFGSKGGATAVFTHARFDTTADFAMSIFNINAHFITTHFLGQGYFPGVRFERSADFSRAHFFDVATFGAGAPANFNSIFKGQAFFNETQFDSFVVFNGVSFPGDVYFASAKLNSRVEFRGTTFDKAEFISTHFDGDAYFENAVFLGPSSFRNATFHAVYFSITEHNGEPQFRSDIDLLGCTYDRIQINWRSVLRYPNGQSRIHPYDRQPYIELEGVLRKAGFEADANEVYAESRRVENGKGLRRFRNGVYWLFANYGIDLWHEVYGSLVSLLIGMLVFLRPKAVVSAEGEPRIGTQIQWWNALSLATHQFLPFTLPVKPRWDLTRHVLYRWRKWPLLTAATYANFLRIVGWILIPLAAAQVTGVLRHVPQ